MSDQKLPVLRRLHIPYPLDQFIRVENLISRVRYPEVVVKFISLGLASGKEIKNIREFPKSFYFKSVAIPAEIDDIIVSKARANKESYNNIFIEYLIVGVKSIKVEDRLQKNWIESLDEFLEELESAK